MEICYSNKDISDRCNCIVLTYKDLLDYDDIDSMLGKHKAAVILYEQKENFGHWCCVFLEDGVLYFFDPYGIFPDEQLKDIDDRYRIKSGQDYHYLSYLMAISPYEVDYNDYQLQDEHKGINTCGRWCVARILNRDLDAEQFAELFEPGDEKINPDLLVTEYTNSLSINNNNN